MNKPVIYKTLEISQLDTLQLQNMFNLFEKYYNDVSFQMFKDDLTEKTHVSMLSSPMEEIIGFSTIFRKPMVSKDQSAYTALFSGDTVIREDYWGTKALQKAFFIFIVKSKILSGTKPLYWFLQSKGFKTYLMMRRNFKLSFPQSLEKTPIHIKSVLDSFYSEKYKECFKKDTGLIQFEDCKGAAKAEVSSPSNKDLLNEDIQFFIQQNAGYHKGDELACITEIRYSDFAVHIPKYFLKIPIFSKLFKSKKLKLKA